MRDVELVAEIRRVYEANLFVYGADKIWAQLNREAIAVGRGRVERLMRREGLSGARRGKAFTVTTTSNEQLERPTDLVARRFTAPAPNRLWVADLTYVKTHTGWVYVAFVIDVFSRFVVGWQASRSLRSDLAIDALEMAVFNRRRAGADLCELIHHNDRGAGPAVSSARASLAQTRFGVSNETMISRMRAMHSRLLRIVVIPALSVFILACGGLVHDSLGQTSAPSIRLSQAIYESRGGPGTRSDADAGDCDTVEAAACVQPATRGPVPFRISSSPVVIALLRSAPRSVGRAAVRVLSRGIPPKVANDAVGSTPG